MTHRPSSRALRLSGLFRLASIPLGFVLVCAPAWGQPANDECTGATAVTSIPFTDSVDTTTATSNPDDPSLGCNGSGSQTDGNTVWYVWTPDEDITVNISTAGSTTPGGGELDTAHGVFTGTCGDLTQVACVDVGLTDDLVFEASAGVTYYIKVGEFLDGAGGGNLVFTVDLPPPPELLVLESVRDGISERLDMLGPATALSARRAPAGGPVEVPMYMRDEKGVSSPAAKGSMVTLAGETPATLARERFRAPWKKPAPNLLQMFDGAENDDNDNLVTTIFDKRGNTILGPFPNNVFWTGLGGPCEFTNIGDPIVLYDEQTDRWFVSQFNDPAGLCIAISETGDPTGNYYQHEFDFTGIGFPDYPKYGFATDAIAVMANIYSPFQGPVLGAIDKTEAFGVNPTTMVLFKVGVSEWGFLPGDNDGPVFKKVPPTFFTNNGGSGDRIDVWEIQPDFAVPSNSTIGEVAKIPVSPFDADLCGAVRERCIDQPEGAPRLEAITDRLMHRLQLRNFGKEKVALVNHTVDADGSGKAGIRWYEFRNHKNRGWTLKKENTFSPDGDHRWMGSIAMNARGETCLGYSISSTTTYPSIGVAGRRGTSNHMNAGELLAFDGNVDQHVQLGTGARWGDYSAMAIDPVDGTCWYTQEYAKPNTRLGELAGWATKIIQVDLQGKGNTKKK